MLKRQDFVRQFQTPGGGLQRQQSLSSRLHLDLLLTWLLLLLMGAGLIVLYSASSQSIHQVQRQLLYYLFGMGAMFMVAQFDPRYFKRWAIWGYLVGVACLVAVLLVGVGAKGAQRWLYIPGVVQFQPSELMKIVVPMTVAWYLAGRDIPPKLPHIIVSLIIIFLPVVLIAKQPDLGTSILISASGFLVIFFAGLSFVWIGVFVGIILSMLPIMWLFVMKEYQKTRVLTLFDPESDVRGAGWNIIQSKIAIGSGGVDGKGWLNGTQSHLDFLPESHTDFIIAVLAEEFGFLGLSVLLLLYIAIVARSLYASVQARDMFGKLLAGSLSITFFIYVFVNIGMVSGILPVVGVPLPLVSYGGTSVVSLLVAFGIIMSIYTHKKY